MTRGSLPIIVACGRTSGTVAWWAGAGGSKSCRLSCGTSWAYDLEAYGRLRRRTCRPSSGPWPSSRPSTAPTTPRGHRRQQPGLWEDQAQGDLAGARVAFKGALAIVRGRRRTQPPLRGPRRQQPGRYPPGSRRPGRGHAKPSERALAIVEAVYGPNHPTWPPSSTTWALLLHALRATWPGHASAFERSLAIDESRLRPRSPHRDHLRQQPGQGPPGPGRLCRGRAWPSSVAWLSTMLVDGPDHPDVASRR